MELAFKIIVSLRTKSNTSLLSVCWEQKNFTSRWRFPRFISFHFNANFNMKVKDQVTTLTLSVMSTENQSTRTRGDETNGCSNSIIARRLKEMISDRGHCPAFVSLSLTHFHCQDNNSSAVVYIRTKFFFLPFAVGMVAVLCCVALCVCVKISHRHFFLSLLSFSRLFSLRCSSSTSLLMSTMSVSLHRSVYTHTCVRMYVRTYVQLFVPFSLSLVYVT